MNGISNRWDGLSEGTRHFDCSSAQLPYYTDLQNDIFERTETAMSQAHCFKVCELALRAQAQAEWIPS